MLMFAALVLIALAVGSFYQDQRVSDHVIRGAISIALQESAAEQSRTLKAELESQYAVLRTLASGVASGALSGDEEILAAMREAIGSSALSSIGYAEASGRMVTTSGVQGTISDKGYFERAMAGERLLECMRNMSGASEMRFLLTQPIAVEGETSGLFQGICPERYFQEILPRTEQCYSFLTDSAGNLIVRSTHASFFPIGDNALDFYREAMLEGGATVEDVAQALQRGSAGVLAYNYGNQYRYVAYTPLGINDWYVFSAQPGARVEIQMTQMRRRTYQLAGKLLVLLAFWALLRFWLDQRVVKRMAVERGWRAQTERLLYEAEQMSQTILFEVDPENGQVAFNRAFEEQFDRPSQVNHLSQLAQGEAPFVDEEREIWRKLAEQMRRGVQNARINARIRHADGRLLWCRVSYVCVYKEDKTGPFRIMGRIVPIEERREQLATPAPAPGPEAEPQKGMEDVRKGSDATSVLIRCTSALVTAATLDDAMNAVLGEMGDYYRADRAYVLAVDESGESIAEKFEWRAKGVPSYGNQGAERKLALTPTLAAALREHKQVTLPDVSRATVSGVSELNELRAQNIRSIYLMPMGEKDATTGFIGIDNAREHLGNVTLLKSLSYFVSSEMRKRTKNA